MSSQGLRGVVAKPACFLAMMLALGATRGLYAQSHTRLLLSSGSGVPGHAGFVFGPFSHLAMNEGREIVFLSSLRSARSELQAVVRSTGVSFTVVAFRGLRSPVPKTSYESFSAPSINNAGTLAFTAALKDEAEPPPAAVIRVEGANHRAVAVSGETVPGSPDSPFLEFSAPVIDSAGRILFGARTGGKKPGTGLFLWTPRGIQSLPLPATLHPTPKDLLEPVYFARDEAVFVPRGTSSDAAAEQFFRAVAIRSFQELNPPPDPTATVEVLAARAPEEPVKMLLVLMEAENVQTLGLEGEPSQPVVAKRPAGVAGKLLGRVEGQTAAARGNVIFAATTADQATDMALYCFCEGQVVRLTSPEEFVPITQFASGKVIFSLTGDAQHTTAFIAPGSSGESSAIYVTSIP